MLFSCLSWLGVALLLCRSPTAVDSIAGSDGFLCGPGAARAAAVGPNDVHEWHRQEPQSRGGVAPFPPRAPRCCEAVLLVVPAEGVDFGEAALPPDDGL